MAQSESTRASPETEEPDKERTSEIGVTPPEADELRSQSSWPAAASEACHGRIQRHPGGRGQRRERQEGSAPRRDREHSDGESGRGREDRVGCPPPRHGRDLPRRRRGHESAAAAAPPAADPLVPRRERPPPPRCQPENRPGAPPLGPPGQPLARHPRYLGWNHHPPFFDWANGVYSLLPGGNSKRHCYITSRIIGSCRGFLGSLLCLFNSSLHWSIIGCCCCHLHHNCFRNHSCSCSYRLDRVPVSWLANCKEKCGFRQAFTDHDELSTFSIFGGSSSPSSAKER